MKCTTLDRGNAFAQNRRNSCTVRPSRQRIYNLRVECLLGGLLNLIPRVFGYIVHCLIPSDPCCGSYVLLIKRHLMFKGTIIFSYFHIQISISTQIWNKYENKNDNILGNIDGWIKQISYWYINWCTYRMMINKIAPSVD